MKGPRGQQATNDDPGTSRGRGAVSGRGVRARCRTTVQPHEGQLHEGQPHEGQPHEAQPHEAQPHEARPHEAQPHEGLPTARARQLCDVT